jgi:hypothetical protein
MRSLRTSGSGRRHTCSAARASTFTRTSLYSNVAPGSRRLRLMYASLTCAPCGGRSAHLTEEVIPREPLVVRGVERHEQLVGAGPVARIATAVRPRAHDGRHVVRHGVVHALDAPVVEREAHHGAHEALRHRVGDFIGRGVTPCRDDVAVPQNHAGRPTTRRQRSNGRAQRLTTKRLPVIELEIARRLALLVQRDGHRRGNAGRIESDG